MIDFSKFVNSETVCNHLQQIQYQPTALEAGLHGSVKQLV